MGEFKKRLNDGPRGEKREQMKNGVQVYLKTLRRIRKVLEECKRSLNGRESEGFEVRN